ncbi:unnamed protein product [Rhizopus microsporus]
MEDFATRYYECNPTLVDKPDVAYAVAFSILLLHTDAHNKNVKQKMDKDTFIRRTKIIEGGEGVPAEILDIMYDNIVISEFTYAKDITTRPERSNSWFSKLISDSTTVTSTNSTSNHTNAQPTTFADLAPKLEQLMPAENTFNYKRNILKPIPIMDIHFSLLTAKSLCLAGVRSKHGNNSNNNTFTIRVTKAGMLDRKHDLMHGGKRATARSWRPFGVILSGSQLIFFSDLSSYQQWLEEEEHTSKKPPRRNSSVPHSVSSMTESASNLSINNATVTSMTSLYSNSNMSTIPPLTTPTLSTPNTYLRPVQIISLSYAVCIHDEAYTKYPHVFRLITGDGQHFLLRASSDEDMDDWMLKINYASALKTTGARIRPFKRRSNDSTGSVDVKYSLEQQKREEEAKEKVQELSDRIEEQIRILDRELQLRRNLMVLAPVQKSTKDRLVAFAEMVGKRIRTKRIELQRLECYRDYLEAELVWCASSQQQSRKVSLATSSYKTTNGRTESFRKLSNLVFTPPSASTSTTSSSSTSTHISHPVSMHSHTPSSSKSDEDDAAGNNSNSSRSNSTSTSTSTTSSSDNNSINQASDTQDIQISFPKLRISINDAPERSAEMDRVMRRRSQSNPILPNKQKLSLLQPPNRNQRERSGSEASHVRAEDDDSMSVVIINDTEGTDSSLPSPT